MLTSTFLGRLRAPNSWALGQRSDQWPSCQYPVLWSRSWVTFCPSELRCVAASASGTPHSSHQQRTSPGQAGSPGSPATIKKGGAQRGAGYLPGRRKRGNQTNTQHEQHDQEQQQAQAARQAEQNAAAATSQGAAVASTEAKEVRSRLLLHPQQAQQAQERSIERDLQQEPAPEPAALVVWQRPRPPEEQRRQHLQQAQHLQQQEQQQLEQQCDPGTWDGQLGWQQPQRPSSFSQQHAQVWQPWQLQAPGSDPPSRAPGETPVAARTAAPRPQRRQQHPLGGAAGTPVAAPPPSTVGGTVHAARPAAGSWPLPAAARAEHQQQSEGQAAPDPALPTGSEAAAETALAPAALAPAAPPGAGEATAAGATAAGAAPAADQHTPAAGDLQAATAAAAGGPPRVRSALAQPVAATEAALPLELCAAAQHSATLLVPPRFRGMCVDSMRPWQAQVVLHLCRGLPPPACHIYSDMRTYTLQRVLVERARAEKALREHREEADWQLRRVAAWARRADARRPLRKDTLERAAREAGNLRSAAGATRAALRRLATAADGYSDADYARYCRSVLLPLAEEVLAAADACAGALLPHVARVNAINARCEWEMRAGDAERALQRRAAELAVLGSPRGVRLGSWRRVPWRYPPPPFVLVKVKGARGGWVPPLVLPGLAPKLPSVRRGKEQLPGGPGDACAGGQPLQHALTGLFD